MFQLFNKNSTFLKSKGATGTPCHYFQVVAAKKIAAAAAPCKGTFISPS